MYFSRYSGKTWLIWGKVSCKCCDWESHTMPQWSVKMKEKMKPFVGHSGFYDSLFSSFYSFEDVVYNNWSQEKKTAINLTMENFNFWLACEKQNPVNPQPLAKIF